MLAIRMSSETAKVLHECLSRLDEAKIFSDEAERMAIFCVLKQLESYYGL